MAEDASPSLNKPESLEGHIAPDVREPIEPADRSPLHQVAEAALALKEKGESGANWFFWVAALSLVNTTNAAKRPRLMIQTP